MKMNFDQDEIKEILKQWVNLHYAVPLDKIELVDFTVRAIGSGHNVTFSVSVKTEKGMMGPYRSPGSLDK